MSKRVELRNGGGDYIVESVQVGGVSIHVLQLLLGLLRLLGLLLRLTVLLGVEFMDGAVDD
jgi:hypothetical protein